MKALRRLLDAPLTELLVGLVLLTAGVLELRDIVLVKLPGRGALLPHVAAALGMALVLRALPGMFLGLEILDGALGRIPWRPALAVVDRVAHCHAVDCGMGVILIVAGAADLLDILFAGSEPPGLRLAYGLIAFGLAPFLNTFLAFYKGLRCLDREYPFRLLDRAVREPWVLLVAGSIMLGGGVSEIMATLRGGHAFGHALAVPGGFTVLGLFALLSGLPGIYLGMRTLSAIGRTRT